MFDLEYLDCLRKAEDSCRRRNCKLALQNRQLKRKLKRIRQAASRLTSEAESRQALGSLPRAAWAYLKAVKETALTLGRLAR